MRFLQFTDLHLRPEGRLAYGMVDSNAIAHRAFEKAAAFGTDIDAIICTGDLADNGLPEEYDQLLSCLAHIRQPVFLVAGNHDRRENMFARLPNLPRHDGFVQYVVEDFPVRLVILDSTVPGATHGDFCAVRLAWLEKILAQAPGRETMIALHHPPFATGIAQYDATMLRGTEAFQAIVAANPQVRRIICGHNHRLAFGNVAQAIAIIGPAIAYQFMLTLDPVIEEGFTLEPSAFLLHEWSKAGGFVTQNLFVETYPGPFQVQLEAEYPGKPV